MNLAMFYMLLRDVSRNEFFFFFFDSAVDAYFYARGRRTSSHATVTSLLLPQTLFPRPLVLPCSAPFSLYFH